MGKLVQKAELAKILGKTERTLTTWQKNGMPIEVDGSRGTANQYDTQAVIEWIIAREIETQFGGDPNGERYNFEQERARLTHHQANKAELEEQTLQGKLIPTELVEMVQTKMLAAFRAKCLALPTKAAPKVVFLDDLAETEAELKKEIYDALNELSEFDPEQYGISIPSDSRYGRTATGSDDQPVG